MKTKIVLIALLFSLSPLTFAADHSMAKVCELETRKKMAFYDSTKKNLQDLMKKLKKDTPEWDEFQDSDHYEWVRFATVKGLPSFADPTDGDNCGAFYLKFILEKKPVSARDKLEAWKSCIRTEYKEEIPAMAKRLIDCHDANYKAIPATKVLAPVAPAEGDDN